jgi:hydrogenase maturation protein HypF
MTTVTACRVSVRGVVQGVGFRPFVYQLATRFGLSGTVRNTSQSVEIEVEGSASAIEAFLDALVVEVPPLAHIDDVEVVESESQGAHAFTIDASCDGAGFLPVPPDVATCSACLREVLDPRDRRFGYPFTNCTHCGPRFTIIRSMPYDRAHTAMAGFAMCEACRREYGDPSDRRFHAQPNACPVCGPRLALVDPTGRPLPGDPLVQTRRLLASGRIVAIEGVGGFHLACDANSDAAVGRLRERKGREAKPLAVMVPDEATARRVCAITNDEWALLASPARPIVILAERPGSGVAPSVAPGLARLGLMLPYSALHHLLWVGEGGCPDMLVMTSGNRSEEPIATTAADALRRLGTIADAFLLHDRPIQTRCDDSVARVAAGAELPLRRSRGYAPLPVHLPFETRPILACGAELKSTVCLARGAYAFLSPHIGDLGNHETYASYVAMVDHMAALVRVRPEAIAHDLHPAYLSTRFAREYDPALPRVAIQHHHAHVAACMAEHRLEGPVLGLSWDGTGYGSDGTIWGGEALVCRGADFRRAAHLRTFPLPGGDQAARQPRRAALGLLYEIFGPAAFEHVGEWFTAAEQRALAAMLARGVNCPRTSSMGRLFDAVAALCGRWQEISFEGQAAMDLEFAADPAIDEGYELPLVGPACRAGPERDEQVDDSAPGDSGLHQSFPAEGTYIADWEPMVHAILADRGKGESMARIATRFHNALARLAVETAAAVGCERVVLTGGCFQNALLQELAATGLRRAGHVVYTHRQVPPGDGGIALGQIFVAAHSLRRSAS